MFALTTAVHRCFILDEKFDDFCRHAPTLKPSGSGSGEEAGGSSSCSLEDNSRPVHPTDSLAVGHVGDDDGADSGRRACRVAGDESSRLLLALRLLKDPALVHHHLLQVSHSRVGGIGRPGHL